MTSINNGIAFNTSELEENEALTKDVSPIVGDMFLYLGLDWILVNVVGVVGVVGVVVGVFFLSRPEVILHRLGFLTTIFSSVRIPRLGQDLEAEVCFFKEAVSRSCPRFCSNQGIIRPQR